VEEEGAGGVPTSGTLTIDPGLKSLPRLLGPGVDRGVAELSLPPLPSGKGGPVNKNNLNISYNFNYTMVCSILILFSLSFL
jgi:hypothetical protein